jgi:hypothetical protein
VTDAVLKRFSPQGIAYGSLRFIVDKCVLWFDRCFARDLWSANTQNQNEADAPLPTSTEVVGIGTTTSAVVDVESQGTFTPDTTSTKMVVERPIGSAPYVPFGEETAVDKAFGRPYVIWSFSWTSSSSESSIDPLSVWVNLTPVQSRLATFSRLRCDLRIRVEFMPGVHYGGLARIWHLPGYNNYTGIKNTGSGRAWQNLGVSLDAGQPSVHEMLLPWVYVDDCLDLTTASHGGLFGKLLFTPIVPLFRDDGGTASGFPVIVRAWAENIVVAGPTTASVQLQAGSEFDGVMGKMMQVPLFRKGVAAAKATAKAVSSYADLLGWSRRIEYTRTRNVPRPPGYMLTDGDDDPASLTYRSNYGIFDGVPDHSRQNVDEMSFPYICGRDSLLGLITVPAGGSVGTSLFVTDVHPMYAWLSATGVYCPVAAGFLAAPFAYWRGTLILTFRVVCTALQSGAVRIYYDPTNAAVGTYPLESARNCVLELKPGASCQMHIGWSHETPWIGTDVAVATTWLEAPDITSAEHNGHVGVVISSPLVSPGAAATAYIVVSMHAGPDFRVIESRSPPGFTWPVVAGLQEEEVELEAAVLSNTAAFGREMFGSPPFEVSSISMGDEIVSLRSLLKRYCLIGSLVSSAAGTAQYDDKTFLSAFPLHEDEAGFGTVMGSSTNPLTYSGVNLFRWYKSMYVGHRGGARYRIRPTNTVYYDGSAVNTAGAPTFRVYTSADAAAGAVGSSASGAFSNLFGSEVVVTADGERFDVRIPDYNHRRFRPAGNVNNAAAWGLLVTRALKDATRFSYAVSKAIDEDFSFIYFTGSPNISSL